MTEVTERDYRVEETEVTRYECDRCGAVVDGDAVLFQKTWKGPGPRSESLGTGHLCPGCAGLDRYLELEEMRGRRERASLFLKPVQALIIGVAISVVPLGLIWGALVHTQMTMEPAGAAGFTILGFFLWGFGGTLAIDLMEAAE